MLAQHRAIRKRHWNRPHVPDYDSCTRQQESTDMTQARTLYDKLVDSHTVRKLDDHGHVLLYIDRQVLNEYTSPQAFSALREAGRKVWRPQAALAVGDHVNPTTPGRTIAITPDAGAPRQVSYLAENSRHLGLELFDRPAKRPGNVHGVLAVQ